MKLLIIEDSTLLIDRLTKLINLVEGVEVIGSAKSIEDALEMVNIHRPEFIILDVLLNGENSLEHLDEIYKMVPNVIVAVFTNYPYNVFKSFSVKKGVKHFFDKSKDLEALLDLIKSSSAKFKNK